MCVTCISYTLGLLSVGSSGRLGDELGRYNDRDDENDPYRFSYSLLIFGLGGVLNIIAAFLILADMWFSHASYNQDYSNREVRSRPFLPEPYQQPMKDYPSKPISYGRSYNSSELYSPVSYASSRRTQDQIYNVPYSSCESSSIPSYIKRDYVRDYATLPGYQRW